MGNKVCSLMAVVLCAGVHGQAMGGLISLGSAESFAVLGGSAVTNIGSSVIRGSVGVWPAASVTGFPPGIVVGGSVHLGNAVAQQAQTDVTAAYVLLAGMTSTLDLTGTDLGGLTLVPGVYTFTSAAVLTGNLTLDFEGNPDALFVFQIVSSLTTASSASVQTINGGDGCNVYWQIGSFATIGTSTAFQGNMLALDSIAMGTSATLEGRALARNGAVTLDSNTITACIIPGPGVVMALLPGLAGLLAGGRRRSV